MHIEQISKIIEYIYQNMIYIILKIQKCMEEDGSY